jgi:two-component system, sensor histidine kinase PdtaS
MTPWYYRHCLSKAYICLSNPPSMYRLFLLLCCFCLLARQTGAQPAPVEQASALVQQSQKLFQKRDYVAAQDALEQALRLARQVQDSAAQGRILKLMGDVYAARSYYRKAIEHYREALPLLRQSEQTELMGECLEKMAGIQAEFGYTETAINHYQRALKVKSGLNDRAGMQFCHSRLARIYFAGKQFEKALQHNQQAMELAGANTQAETDGLIQELVILTFLGRREAAAKALQKARTVLQGQNDLAARIKLFSATSNYYLSEKDSLHARIYLDSAATLIRGSQNPEIAVDALEQMALIHQKNGDFQSAYEAAILLDRYKDIFRNENFDRISAEINDAAATALREKEIDFLNLENQLKAAQLRQAQILRLTLLRENLYKDSTLSHQERLVAALTAESELRTLQLEQEKSLNLALQRENLLKQQNLEQEQHLQTLLWIGLSLFALSGAVIFYLFRRQRRYNRIIRKQSDELVVLNKEVHHRVKNNLQVISSMLDLQAQTLQDPEAKTGMREAILRVQAMAFIHQNLYQDDSASTVDMPDYIHTLCRHLFNTYNIHSDAIRLELQVQALRLHTDTAIPLGMILNELIGNSLKYAFKDRENGLLRVLLQQNGEVLELQVQDDGKGLPEGFNPEQQRSFGYEMILAFALKLKARITFGAGPGADVRLHIHKFKLQ